MGDALNTAIIIPELVQPGFLFRQLAYYADLGIDNTIYVGDSNTRPEFDRVHGLITKLARQLNIKHIQLSSADRYQGLEELLTRVNESYAAFVDDDDFLVPESLKMCAEFLESHADYQSAHGQATIFTMGSTSEYGEITDSMRFPQRPVEQDSPRNRLMDLFQRHWPVEYSVQRVEPYRRAVELTSGQSHFDFRKLLIESFLVVQGKAKEFERLYLVKQRHYQYMGSPVAEAIDWITSPKWSPSYGTFSACLANELARQEEIALEEAQDVVKQAFWTYLANRLNERRIDRSRSDVGAGPKSRILRLGKFVPGARWAFSEYTKWKVAKLDDFSLPVLLSKSSPYHRDFKAVFRAASAPSLGFTVEGT